MAKTIIKINNLYKNYGNQTVVNNLNLDIIDGEFLTLLGPSGCGKTTILRMIGGFETPDKGKLLLGENDLIKIPPNKREINTVFQSYALFQHLTVRENISFGLKIKKVPKNEIEKRVDEILEITHLEALAMRKPSKLSGGQQQRVAIARSLVNHPKVLLLDEPLGALDLQLRKQMQIDLKRLQKKLGITYIYVTHDQEEALSMSDRIAVMHNGKMEQIGTPNEIYNYPKTEFVAKFLGESNFFDGVYEKITENSGNFKCEGINVPVSFFKEGTPTLLSLRPEFVELHKEKISGFSISAVIEQVVFLGQNYRISAKLKSGKIIHSLDETGLYAKGDKVNITWNPINSRLII